jgi:hypothetical protein
LQFLIKKKLNFFSAVPVPYLFQFLTSKPRIRIGSGSGIRPKMLDTDPDQMNTVP